MQQVSGPKGLKVSLQMARVLLFCPSLDLASQTCVGVQAVLIKHPLCVLLEASQTHTYVDVLHTNSTQQQQQQPPIDGLAPVTTAAPCLGV